MLRETLRHATDDVLELVLKQAHERLESQCEFAGAQEERAGALITFAATLAAASVPVAIGAFVAKVGPLGWAGTLASIGFSLAASIALWASRSAKFHPVGYYTEDFRDDIDNFVTYRVILEDIAFDYNRRLVENSKTLSLRGRMYNLATAVFLLSTPTSLIAAYIAI